VAVVPVQSSADSYYRRIVETRAMRAEPHAFISLNAPLCLTAGDCTLQLTSEAEINKQLQLLFATTLTLRLRYCLVKLILILAEINEN